MAEGAIAHYIQPYMYEQFHLLLQYFQKSRHRWLVKLYATNRKRVVCPLSSAESADRLNPFPHATNLQQMTAYIFVIIWKLNRIENIVTNGEIALSDQSFLLSQCIKENKLMQRRNKTLAWGKGFKVFNLIQISFAL